MGGGVVRDHVRSLKMTASLFVNVNGASSLSVRAPSCKNYACFDLSIKDTSPIAGISVSSSSIAEIRGGRDTIGIVGLHKGVGLSHSSCNPNSVGRSWTTESVRFSSVGRSSYGLDTERKCHPTTEREAVAEEEKSAAPESEFLFSGQATLNRLSHFLRELARQDCWAGLLDPFQSAGGSFNQVTYSMQELKFRNTPIPLNKSASAFVSQIPTSVSETSPGMEQHSLSDSVVKKPLLSSVDSPISLASIGPGSELPSVVSEMPIGSKSSQDGDDYGSSRASVVDISAATSVSASPKVETSSSGSSNHQTSARERPQAELCHNSAVCVTAEEIGSVENLSLWLEERMGRSIISKWGTAPGSKRVANLWCELVEGEISLEDCRPPKRTAHVVSVKIRNDAGHVLVEAYQEMADGRIRTRNRPLSEKMRPGEHVEAACLRGILEELGGHMGASERVVIVPESYRRGEEERLSFSYPGLPTRYVIHTMSAHVQQLPSTEFSTEEDESNHGGNLSGASNGDARRQDSCVPMGVKRHFWRWIPESELADFCRR